MATRSIILFVCVFLCARVVKAQNDSTIDQLSIAVNVDGKVINNLQKQYSSLQSKLNKQSSKLLSKLQRKEDKLHAKLSGIDSAKIQAVFTDDVKQKYQNLRTDLTKPTDNLNNFPLKEYIPGLDSLQTSLG